MRSVFALKERLCKDKSFEAQAQLPSEVARLADLHGDHRSTAVPSHFPGIALSLQCRGLAPREHLPRPWWRPRPGPLPTGRKEEGRICSPKEKGILEDRARCRVSLRGSGAGQRGSWGPWESGGGGPAQTALYQFRPVPGGRGGSFRWDQSWDLGFSSPEAKASLWPSDAFSLCFSVSFPLLKSS